MIRIDSNLLDGLISKAKNSDRLRTNHNFHNISSDRLQRMLNVMEKGSYFQPHKHENPDKREVFIVLKGRIAVVEFGDTGKVADFIILDPQTDTFGVEIAPRTWHTLIPLQNGSVAYEVKDGPYDPKDDKIFAAWAPKEGDPNCKNYVNDILTKLNI